MSQIPEDFGTRWPRSDVVLIAENSDGKELHACKSFLGIFSRFFESMFFSGFKEAEQDTVPVPCDYEALKEILCILHHVNRDYTTNGQKLYEPSKLESLYCAADVLDIAEIRRLCIEQMLDRPSTEMAVTALFLGLHDTMMEILVKIPSTDVESFLLTEDDQLIFSRNDVAFIYEKITENPLPSDELPQPSGVPLHLEELYNEIEEPRIDVTKKWYMSDLQIMTNNSLGRTLYSNRTALAMVSTLLKDMLFSKNNAEEEAEEDDEEAQEENGQSIKLDFEYATVKQILSIIHHCNMKFRRSDFIEYQPALLHDMLCAANDLDIPMIKQLCIDNLLEQLGVACFNVAVKLNLTDIKSVMVKHMYRLHLRNWVLSEDKDLVYMKGGKEIVVTPNKKDQVLTVKDLRVVIQRLREKYIPKIPA